MTGALPDLAADPRALRVCKKPDPVRAAFAGAEMYRPFERVAHAVGTRELGAHRVRLLAHAQGVRVGGEIGKLPAHGRSSR